MPTKSTLTEPAPVRQKRTIALNNLEPTCDSNIRLLSHPETLSLAFSLIGVPGLAAGNAKTIGKLACWAVKSINRTSTAISLLNREQKELRQAILQDRAAIDFLLMQSHFGCEKFQGLCCFNLTDNSKEVDKQLDSLNDLVNEVKQREGSIIDSIWEAFTSWLPDVSWVKHVFVYILGFIVIAIMFCCFVQCLPYIFSIVKASFQPKSVPVCMLDEVKENPFPESVLLSGEGRIWERCQN